MNRPYSERVATAMSGPRERKARYGRGTVIVSLDLSYGRKHARDLWQWLAEIRDIDRLPEPLPRSLSTRREVLKLNCQALCRRLIVGVPFKLYFGEVLRQSIKVDGPPDSSLGCYEAVDRKVYGVELDHGWGINEIPPDDYTIAPVPDRPGWNRIVTARGVCYRNAADRPGIYWSHPNLTGIAGPAKVRSPFQP